MSVALKQCFTNPFEDYPEFKKIWPEFSSNLAQEVIAKSIEKKEDGLYVILYNDTPVGMTGFFDLEYPEGKYWGLRWHGVLPEYRGKGISEHALYITAMELKKHHPECIGIVEYIPHTDYSNYIFKYFERFGFQAWAEPETVDWAPHKIQAYGINLDELIDFGVKRKVIPSSLSYSIVSFLRKKMTQ